MLLILNLISSMEKDIREPISIGLPRTLIKKLDEACKKDRRSRSSYVVVILEEHFKKLEEEQKPSRLLIRP